MNQNVGIGKDVDNSWELYNDFIVGTDHKTFHYERDGIIIIGFQSFSVIILINISKKYNNA